MEKIKKPLSSVSLSLPDDNSIESIIEFLQGVKERSITSEVIENAVYFEDLGMSLFTFREETDVEYEQRVAYIREQEEHKKRLAEKANAIVKQSPDWDATINQFMKLKEQYGVSAIEAVFSELNS